MRPGFGPRGGAWPALQPKYHVVPINTPVLHAVAPQTLQGCGSELGRRTFTAGE